MSSNPSPDGTLFTEPDAPAGSEPAAGNTTGIVTAPGRIGRSVKLRTKLIVSIVALIVLVCATMAVATEVFLGRYLTEQLDQRLNATQGQRLGLDTPRDVAEPGQPTASGAPTGAATPQVSPPRTTFNLTVCPTTTDARSNPQNSLDSIITGNKITSTAIRVSFICQNVSAAVAAPLLDVVPGAKPITVSIEGFGSYRVSARQTAGSNQTIVTGLSLGDDTKIQIQLAVIMAIVAGVAIIIGGVVVFWVVRRSVRPLERVAATARKVSTLPLDKGEVDLGIRVPDKDTDPRTEIGQVGSALNQMLVNVSGALTARQASETRVRQFVADASHELRTPLAAIRGYAELARRGEYDPSAVSHALRRVESESSRMTTLVEDLLLLARLDSGRPLAREEVDLTMLAVDRVSDARVAGPEHRWQLDLPDEPVTVTGDSARLHQVLANLLTNARNHTPPGTLVTTGIREEPDGVVLTVTDNGPGIPSELQPEIFGRFVRGDSSRSRAAGSTGLGLAIVAAVIASHGGSVSVESRPGRTCARVWLPNDMPLQSETVEDPKVPAYRS